MKILTSILTGSFGSYNKLKDHDKAPNIQGLMEYANKCFNNGRVKDAIKEYHEALRAYECVELYNNLALIYHAEKKLDKAQQMFEKALVVDARDLLVKYNLGHFFYLNNKIAEAMEQFSGITEWAEGKTDLTEEDKIWVAFAYNDLGCAWYRKEDKEKAIENFKKSLEMEKTFLSAQNNLANVYSSQEKYDEALAEYNKIIELDNAFAEAYNGMGAIYFKRDEIKKAAELFQKAYQIDNHCQVAYMNLQTLFKLAQQQALYSVKEEAQKKMAQEVAARTLEEPGQLSDTDVK
ncbi:MAG: tetratricopeptide repeat protein [bacterium]